MQSRMKWIKIRARGGLGLVFVLLSLLSGVRPATAAVNISSFTAKWQSNQVIVAWSTSTEIADAAYSVWRSSSQNGTYTQVSQVFNAMRSTQPMGYSYSFTDTSAPAGQVVYYKLQIVSLAGSKSFHDKIATATLAATATSTKTTTRAPSTNTPTSTQTALPTNTPTRTQTYPPGVTPPTPVPTNTPTITLTPTRTQTYPPGVKPPTPVPTTPTLVAAVVPGTNAPQPGINPHVATTPSIGSNGDSSAANGGTDSGDAVLPEDNSDTAANPDATMTLLLRLGVIAVSGILGLGALGFGVIAIILLARMSR